MRRVLVLGGTAWLGREVTSRALARGDEVTCLARGRSGQAVDGVRFVAADRTEPGAFDDLAGEFDEVVELAYHPVAVRSALDALAARAAHWTLVSTISVYAGEAGPGADETAPLVEASDDPEDYGGAKVAAEQASAAALGERLLVVRPGLITGPGDPSDRFGYWPARLARGGRVLTPPLTGADVQVIDVADLADYLTVAAAAGVTGVVQATGESVGFDRALAIIAEVTGFDGELVEAPASWLIDQGVGYWMGPRSLPLWLPPEASAMRQLSIERFRATGGVNRPLADVVARVLGYERRLGLDRPRRSGLSAAEEAELLARL